MAFFFCAANEHLPVSPYTGNMNPRVRVESFGLARLADTHSAHFVRLVHLMLIWPSSNKDFSSSLMPLKHVSASIVEVTSALLASGTALEH